MFIELLIKIEGEEAVRLAAHGEKFAFYHTSEGEKAEGKLKEFVPVGSKKENFFRSDKVRAVQGVLLDKSQTPWALSQLNVFETIVESEKK